MDADSFTDLALRDIAGETTDDERLALKKAMSSHPARQVEYEQLLLTYQVLRTTVPMADALKATGPELPAYRLGQLRTAVRQEFGPAIRREQREQVSPLRLLVRWLAAGSTVTALALAVVFFSLASSSVEVGLYQSDVVRSGDNDALTPSDVPQAKIVAFAQDAPFDQWQNQPLSWTQRAKIWVDNEHDLLHVVRRDGHGQVTTVTLPLAPTNAGQREQIKETVESLNK